MRKTYHTQSLNGNQKEKLGAFSNPPPKSSKLYAHPGVESELQQLIGLVRPGSTLEDPDLHKKQMILPADLVHYFQARGTPEEILKSFKSSQPKKQLPVYDVILQNSWKLGFCTCRNNKLRSILASQGHWISDCALNRALATLEKARLIFRYSKAHGLKKGSTRIIVPLGMAHRAASLIHSLGLKQTAAYLLCDLASWRQPDLDVQMKLAHKAIEKAIAKRTAARQKKSARPEELASLLPLKLIKIPRNRQRNTLNRRAKKAEGALPKERNGISPWIHHFQSDGMRKALEILGLGSPQHLEWCKNLLMKTEIRILKGISSSLALWLKAAFEGAMRRGGLLFTKDSTPSSVDVAVSDEVFDFAKAAVHFLNRDANISAKFEGDRVIVKRWSGDGPKYPKELEHKKDERYKVSRVILLKKLSYESLFREFGNQILKYASKQAKAIWEKFLVTKQFRTLYT